MNSATIIGISDYPPGISCLPGVAADVREIAKLLQSPCGTFSQATTKVLTDIDATKSRIESALAQAFSSDESDTVFVYLAGHGFADGDRFFFVSHDTNPGTINETGVPLAFIKKLFDDCNARRVFLWLDCCHSGGILAKRSVEPGTDALRRELRVVTGEGRLIFAACTAGQSAYEDSNIGHGLFTHALLRGLQGEAVQSGEVTALSLFDFIDRATEHKQTPMLFGSMEGRIVLIHHEPGDATPPPKDQPHSSPANTNRLPERVAKHWILLGDTFLDVVSVRRDASGDFSIAINSDNAELDARIQSLGPHGNLLRNTALSNNLWFSRVIRA